MSSDDEVAQVRNKLAGLERENSDRFYLVDKRAAEALKAREEATDELRKETADSLTKLREEKERVKAAGGWVTEATVAGKVEDDGDFGFEEDEEENERRAGYRTDDSPAHRMPSYPPPQPAAVPPPPAPVPEPGRHRRSAARSSDDDDFADTDWLAT